METGNKKILLNIAYYSVLTLAIAFSIIFMIVMPPVGVAMYQRVVYTIWSILLILIVMLDIVATCCIHSLKYLVGLIVAGLAFLCLVVGVIIYAGMSIGGLIPFYALTRFFLVIGFSVGLTILTIVTFCVGERLVELNTTSTRGKQ